MSLDGIEKIKGFEAVQNLLKEIGNKDGRLDKAEESIFSEKLTTLVESKIIDAEDVEAIMGFFRAPQAPVYQPVSNKSLGEKLNDALKEGKHPIDPEALIKEAEADGLALSRKERKEVIDQMCATIYSELLKECDGSTPNQVWKQMMKVLEAKGYCKFDFGNNAYGGIKSMREFASDWDKRNTFLELRGRSNKIEQRKTQAKDELYNNYAPKGLGKKEVAKRKEIIDALIANGYITYDEEKGVYDLTKFSAEIGALTGSDDSLNGMTRQNDAVAEKREARAALAGVLTKMELTKSQAYDLVRLSGRDVDGIWEMLIPKNAIPAGLVGGGSGALAAATNPVHAVKVGGVLENTLNLEIGLNFEGVSEAAQQAFTQSLTTDCPDAVVEGGKILVNIHQLIENPEELIKFSKHIGATALKSAAIAAACAAIADLINGKDEIPEVSIIPRGETLEEYMDFLKADKKYARYVNILVPIAMMFTDKNGKLDKAGLMKYIQDNISGNEILNKEELFSFYRKNIGTKGEIKVEEPKPVQKTDKDAIEIHKTEAVKPEEVTVPFEWKPTHSWMAVFRSFYPEVFEKYGETEAYYKILKAFRKAQGLTAKQGCPTNQTVHMDDLVIDGITFKVNKDGQKLLNDGNAKEYGWNYKFYSKNWDTPAQKATATGKARSTEGKPEQYDGKRHSDGQTVSGKGSSQAVEDALMPKATDNKIEVIVIDENGKKKTVIVEPDKK